LPILKATDMLGVTNFFRWASATISTTLSKDEATKDIPALPPGLDQLF